MSEESTDCLQCRLISGGFLLAGGLHLIYQSKNPTAIKIGSSSLIPKIVGYGLCLIGAMRLSGYSFKRKSTELYKIYKPEEKKDEYIVGKFPTKF